MHFFPGGSQAGSDTVVVLGAGGAPAAAKEGDSIAVGYSNIAGDEISLWVAVDEWYFGAHALNVDAQLLAGGANTVAALLSGQVQFTHAGGSEALNATASGADLVVEEVTFAGEHYRLDGARTMRALQPRALGDLLLYCSRRGGLRAGHRPTARRGGLSAGRRQRRSERCRAP